ncbi:unnamed protein product [Closterium sp. Naga37s-1]|nr:unnamed protein product [Closterium sp. Naga37s-1]
MFNIRPSAARLTRNAASSDVLSPSLRHVFISPPPSLFHPSSDPRHLSVIIPIAPIPAPPCPPPHSKTAFSSLPPLIPRRLRYYNRILIVIIIATQPSQRYEQTGNAICLKARDDNAAAATQSGAFDLNYADVMFAGVDPGSSIKDGNGICYDSAAPGSASFLDIQYYVNITSFGRTYVASLPTRLLPAVVAQASFSVNLWWNRVTGADPGPPSAEDGSASDGAAAAASAASAATVAAGADAGGTGSLNGQQQQRHGGADVVVLNAVNKASKPLEVIGAPSLVTLDPADSPKQPTTETVAAPAAAYSLRYTTFDIALHYVLPKYLNPTYASNGQLSFTPRATQPGATGAAAILFTSERDAVYAGGVTWIVSYLVHRPDPSPLSVGFQFVLFEASFYQPPANATASASSAASTSSSGSAAVVTPSPVARRLLLAQGAAEECSGLVCSGRTDAARSGAAAFVCRPRYPCPLGCTPGKNNYPNCCLACSAS